MARAGRFYADRGTRKQRGARSGAQLRCASEQWLSAAWPSPRSFNVTMFATERADCERPSTAVVRRHVGDSFAVSALLHIGSGLCLSTSVLLVRRGRKGVLPDCDLSRRSLEVVEAGSAGIFGLTWAFVRTGPGGVVLASVRVDAWSKALDGRSTFS